jgi:hypothetical protein
LAWQEGQKPRPGRANQVKETSTGVDAQREEQKQQVTKSLIEAIKLAVSFLSYIKQKKILSYLCPEELRH